MTLVKVNPDRRVPFSERRRCPGFGQVARGRVSQVSAEHRGKGAGTAETQPQRHLGNGGAMTEPRSGFKQADLLTPGHKRHAGAFVEMASEGASAHVRPLG